MIDHKDFLLNLEKQEKIYANLNRSFLLALGVIFTFLISDFNTGNDIDVQNYMIYIGIGLIIPTIVFALGGIFLLDKFPTIIVKYILYRKNMSFNYYEPRSIAYFRDVILNRVKYDTKTDDLLMRKEATRRAINVFSYRLVSFMIGIRYLMYFVLWFLITIILGIFIESGKPIFALIFTLVVILSLQAYILYNFRKRDKN